MRKRSSADSSSATLALAVFTRASCVIPMNWGMIVAARMPRITTTTMSSIRVKARRRNPLTSAPFDAAFVALFIELLALFLSGAIDVPLMPWLRQTSNIFIGNSLGLLMRNSSDSLAHLENGQQYGNHHK